jgi:ABC-type branched-subunit amino acid transport system substrate-binding protein
MRHRWIAVLCCVLAICLLVPMLVGCGNKEETETRTLIIGDLTDFTGPGATALTPITWALVDYCNYVNTEGLLPGVRLAVVSYDTKYETTRYSPGFDSLKAQGAQVIFTGSAAIAAALKTRAEIDKIPIVSAGASQGLIDPPGWVFCECTMENPRTSAMLNWLNKNDWKGTGPAKIGLVGYNMPPSTDQASALESYCVDNPSQYSLVGISLVPYGTMTWSSEVEKYKGCDYLIIGAVGAVMPSTFIDQYRAAGGQAKLIGADGLGAYFGAVIDKVGWPAIDGTIINAQWGWWNLDSDQVRLAEQLLVANHTAEEAEKVKKVGIGGIGGAINAQVAVELVKAVIEKVGIKDFSGEEFYETVQTVAINMPGYEQVDFQGEGNRQGSPWIQMYKWSAADQDMVLLSDWIDCTK